MLDLTIFIAQRWLFAYLCGYSGLHGGKETCSTLRICMGMDVCFGVYSCTLTLQGVVQCYKVFICSPGVTPKLKSYTTVYDSFLARGHRIFIGAFVPFSLLVPHWWLLRFLFVARWRANDCTHQQPHHHQSLTLQMPTVRVCVCVLCAGWICLMQHTREVSHKARPAFEAMLARRMVLQCQH